jgi:phenylpropionate dioxygenase-like ring-hydroxylating dioxygenase large terminal subunit
MGDLFRQYWLPAIRSDELPAPDCPPVRIRLLGENLIGYRTTSGAIGLMQNACPHRGASMFFGRNEEEGLRCVYHGWKFDVEGNCVDMPSEPPESNFRSKVKAVAYPCRERRGIIWAYMGPRETPPPLPDIEANQLAEGPHQISVLYRPCNWMQGWEGEMDTVHAAFLHGGANMSEHYEPGSFNYYQYRDRSARFRTIDTEYGLCNGAFRPAEDDTYYWRITQILFPFYNMTPTGALGSSAKIGIYVPMDDDHHLHWEIAIRPPGAPVAGTNAPRIGAPAQNPAQGPSAFAGDRLPNTTDWYGRFHSPMTLENDYLIDRESQATWKTYTGILNGRIQDCAVTETMGPIYQRDKEHLGTTDQLIIRARRRMIELARNLREKGEVPPGVDNPEVYRVRSGEVILPRSADWFEATKELRSIYEVPAEAPRINA